MVIEFSLYFGSTLYDSLTTNTPKDGTPGYRRLELNLYLPRLSINSRSDSGFDDTTGYESEFSANTTVSTYVDSTYDVYIFTLKILGFGIGFNYQDGNKY